MDELLVCVVCGDEFHPDIGEYWVFEGRCCDDCWFEWLLMALQFDLYVDPLQDIVDGNLSPYGTLPGDWE